MSPNSCFFVENNDNMFDTEEIEEEGKENNRNKKLYMFPSDEMRRNSLKRW